MNLARRRFLQLAGAVAAGLPHAAAALDYPGRPLRIVVGFPAGTSADIHARLVEQPSTSLATRKAIGAIVKASHLIAPAQRH